MYFYKIYKNISPSVKTVHVVTPHLALFFSSRGSPGDFTLVITLHTSVYLRKVLRGVSPRLGIIEACDLYVYTRIQSGTYTGGIIGITEFLNEKIDPEKIIKMLKTILLFYGNLNNRIIEKLSTIQFYKYLHVHVQIYNNLIHTKRSEALLEVK